MKVNGYKTACVTSDQEMDDHVCYLIYDGENGCKKQTAKANAHLIAAAPDLLEALDNLINEVSPIIHKMGVKKAFSQLIAIEKAKTAITKATTF
jgi:phage tail protein X